MEMKDTGEDEYLVPRVNGGEQHDRVRVIAAAYIREVKEQSLTSSTAQSTE